MILYVIGIIHKLFGMILILKLDVDQAFESLLRSILMNQRFLTSLVPENISLY